MKKFSTATVIFALLTLTTSQAFAEDKKKCALRPDAPEKHVVAKGDTLWGLSTKFLELPWCWPEVWGMNSEQIRNPHWIFPGQIIYIDHAAGKLRLASPAGAPTVTPNTPPPVASAAPSTMMPRVMPSGPGAAPSDARVSPKIYSTPVDKNGLSSIDPKVIEPFLSQVVVVEEKELKNAPRIVGTMDGRVKLGQGDRAYVRGVLDGHGVFNVFRPVEPLRDPDTGKVIGYEASHVGVIQLKHESKDPKEAHSFDVIEANKEMEFGDRLIFRPQHALVNYVPHPPEKPVSARIVSIYDGVEHAGQGTIVSINRGTNHGMEVGVVLNTFRLGVVLTDKTDSSFFFKSKVKFPDEESGSIFVFRVFKNVSYGLIMEAKNLIGVGDVVRSPE
jgi:hypothetical protein